jgi:hypothetical protein
MFFASSRGVYARRYVISTDADACCSPNPRHDLQPLDDGRLGPSVVLPLDEWRTISRSRGIADGAGATAPPPSSSPFCRIGWIDTSPQRTRLMRGGLPNEWHRRCFFARQNQFRRVRSHCNHCDFACCGHFIRTTHRCELVAAAWLPRTTASVGSAPNLIPSVDCYLVMQNGGIPCTTGLLKSSWA